MTGTDLAELTFLAHVDYFRHLSESSGGEVLDDGGLTCFSSPHPLPFVVNGAVRSDRAADPSAVLGRAQEFFAERGRGFHFLALAGVDDDLVAAAPSAGYTVDHDGEPLQALTTGPLLDAGVEGVDLRPVKDATAVADYTAVCVDAHAAYSFPVDLFPTIFARPRSLLAPRVHPVVGYDGDRPVACAMAFLTQGVVYVGWVAVVRDQQRRGLGATVTSAVANIGLRLGASAAVLMASPMGAPVYRRMGYADVGVVLNLAPPAGATAHA